MRLEIFDEKKECRGVWVAKTKRGFNQRQLKEQRECREAIERRRKYYAMSTESAKDPNYQAALLEWMTRQ